MKLVDMKTTKAEREERSKPSSMAEDQPIYPWGLSLTLDNASLEKLGISTPPAVGETLTLVAQVKVTSCSSHESSDGKNSSCSLQIEKMALEEPDGTDSKKTASKLYGE